MNIGVPSLGSVSLKRVLSEDRSCLSGFGVTKRVLSREDRSSLFRFDVTKQGFE